MPLPLYYTRRRTGWQNVYGLRADVYPLGYDFQDDLGNIDAPTSMPAGAVIAVTDTRFPPARWAHEANFLRDEA